MAEPGFFASNGYLTNVRNVEMYRQVDLSGTGEKAIASFQATIADVIEQQMLVNLEHAGVEIKKVVGYFDIPFYPDKIDRRLMTEAKNNCLKYKIDSKSTMSVNIIAFQIKKPIVLSFGNLNDRIEEKDFYGRKKYKLIPNDWAINKEKLEKYLSNREYLDFPFFIDSEEINKHKVWSSEWSESQNIENIFKYYSEYVEILKNNIAKNNNYDNTLKITNEFNN